MSTSGLQNEYNPPTLDGLTVIEADQIILDGQEVNIDALVPYTGANKTVNLGSQRIQSSYNATVGSDLVNLTMLTNAVTFVDTANALTYLNKVTSTPQTVTGSTTFNNALNLANNKEANLASMVIVGPTYQNLITSASVTVSQNFGTITNSSGVYQSTTNTAGGSPILIMFPIVNGKKYRFSIEVLVTDAVYDWFVNPLQSTDNINPVTGGVLTSLLITTNTVAYQLIDLSFDAVITGNIIFEVSSNAPGVNNKVFQWKNLKVFESGVALTNASMPSQTADRVLVLNTNKQVVASGINTTKLGYLDNVSSDIQTQLNSKASTSYVDTQDGLRVLKSGDTMTGTLVMGVNKITTSYTPVNAEDLTRKGYVDSAIAAIGTNYLPLTGGTMAGNITMNGNGFIGTINISSSLNTTPLMKWASLANHITNSASEVFLFNGINGYIAVADSTTRSASVANLMMGSTGVDCSVESIASDGSTYLPLAFYGSNYYFSSGSVLFSNANIYRLADVSVRRAGNTSLAVVAGGESNDAILYLGTPFNSSTANGSGSAYKVAIIADGNGSGLGWSTADLHFCLNSSTGGTSNNFTNSASVSDSKMVIKTNGRVGINTTNPSGDLHVKLAGAVNDFWGNFIVKTTSFWGDGCSTRSETAGTQYATVYPMMYMAPHIVSDSEGFCRIRLGRAGGVASGRWWEVATRSDGWFNIGVEAANQLSINPNGSVILAGSLDVGGGDHLRLSNEGSFRRIQSFGGIPLHINPLGSNIQIGAQNTVTSILGVVNVRGNSPYAAQNGHMSNGSLTIGSGDTNYGWGWGWSGNTAGLLFECQDLTEIAVHDSGNRVASMIAYAGGAGRNTLLLGRDMSWGPSFVYTAARFSVATDTQYGHFNIYNPDGSNTHFGTSERVNYMRGGMTLFDTSTNSSWYLQHYLENSGLRAHNANGTWGVAIWAGATIVTQTWFGTVSDRRIKKNIRPVGSLLDVINKIEVVSFDFIDSVTHKRDECGVIAQQLEQVFPNAVDKSQGVIANIVRRATRYDIQDGKMMIEYKRSDADELVVGCRVKLIIGSHEKEADKHTNGDYVVKVLTVNANYIVVEWKEEFSMDGLSVIVYGKEVDDFRNVDKEQLGVMAIKGIQELSQQMDVIVQRNNVLEAWARQQEEKVKEQEVKQKKMEKDMEKMASLISQLMGK